MRIIQDRTVCDVLVLQIKIVQYVMRPTNYAWDASVCIIPKLKREEMIVSKGLFILRCKIISTRLYNRYTTLEKKNQWRLEHATFLPTPGWLSRRALQN